MTRRQAERWVWVAAGVGLAGAAIGWIVAPTEFPHAWLAAGKSILDLFGDGFVLLLFSDVAANGK